MRYANVVDDGDRYEFRIELRDKLDQLSDPATVTLRVEQPSGTILGPWTWAGAEVTRESLGIFFREHTLDEAGIWTAEWTTTGTPTVREHEYVVVREGAIVGEPDETLSSLALVPLERALEFLDVDLGDVDSYDDVRMLVGSASAEILKVAGREFVPFGSNPQTRRFEVRSTYRSRHPGGIVEYGDLPETIRVGDLASFTAVEVDDVALTVDELAAVVSLPLNRRPWEPIRMLRLRGAVGYSYDSAIDVTGNFGFPSVPDGIRQACLRQVKFWYDRDTAKPSDTAGGGDVADVPRDVDESERALLRSVYDAALRWAVPGLGGRQTR